MRLGRWWLAALGIAALLLVVLAPVFLGVVGPQWDAIDYYVPFHSLVGDFARHGRLLLWNPYVSFGSPDYVEPQIGALSPLVLLFGAVFGASRLGFELYWFGMWLLGPLGVLLLARQLRAPAWGGYVAAAGFALSGFYTGHAEHTSFVSSLSFLPLVLWRLDVAITDDRLTPALQAGALWGLSALAGYPAIVFLNACFAALWAVGRARQIGRRLARLAPMLLAMSLVGVAVLSPTYVAFMVEGRGYSHRAGALRFEQAVGSNALDPRALWTLFSPKAALAEGFPYTDISMRSIYVGIAAPALAVLALSRRRARFEWFLLAVGIAFLLAALAQSLPVRGWIYTLVPPTRYFRHSAIFRAYFMLALIVLALHGARRLAAARTRAVLHRVLPSALVVFATLDALATARVSRGVIYGYGPPADAWARMDATHVSRLDLTAQGLWRVADNDDNQTLVSKVPAASGYSPLTGPLVREFAGDSLLRDAAVGSARLWFSPTVVHAERSVACLAALRAATAARGAPPLVVHDPRAMDAPADTGEAGCAADLARLNPAQRLDPSAVQVVAYDPTHLQLRVTVPEAGWLLVTDTWSRGWSAVVDGRPTPVWGGNFLFRAIPVRAGVNGVSFAFHAFAHPWLLLVSWGTLAIVAAVSVVARRRVSRGTHDDDADERRDRDDQRPPARPPRRGSREVALALRALALRTARSASLTPSHPAFRRPLSPRAPS